MVISKISNSFEYSNCSMQAEIRLTRSWQLLCGIQIKVHSKPAGAKALIISACQALMQPI